MNFDQVIVIAQDDGPPPKPPGGMGQMLPLFLLFGIIFYFLMIRPQRKQQKALEALRSSMNVGDDVITAGGIHGQITGKSDRTVTIRVADGAKIKFEKSSITQVFPKNRDKGGKNSPADEAEENPDDESGNQA